MERKLFQNVIWEMTLIMPLKESSSKIRLFQSKSLVKSLEKGEEEKVTNDSRASKAYAYLCLKFLIVRGNRFMRKRNMLCS